MKFFMEKEKKSINFLTAFFISHKSNVKTFLKWIINQCPKGTRQHDPINKSILIPHTNSLFGSLERKESTGEQRGGEQRGMVILHLVWMFLKLVRGKGVISPSSYLDILKMRRERRGNDLNRQIYPYLKIDLQHQSMINLLD